MIRLKALPAGARKALSALAAEARGAVGVDAGTEPAAIARAIHTHIGGLRGQPELWSPPTRAFPAAEAENLALPLGALWGEQLVRAMGWKWVTLDDSRPGVASPDGAYAAAPLSDVYWLLTDTTQVESMLLLFNMIVGDSLPPREAKTVLIAGHYTG